MNAWLSLRQIVSVFSFELPRKYLNWKALIPLVSAIIVIALAYSNGLTEMNNATGDVRVLKFIRPMAASAVMVLAISAASHASEDLSTDFEHNTGYMLFTKPVGRFAVFTGKYLSSFVASLPILALYYGAMAVLSISAAGQLPDRFPESVALALLYIAAATGICMMFSSLSPHGSFSLIVSFILLVVLPIFLQNVGFSSEPWMSLGYSSGIVGNYMLANQTIFISDDAGMLHTEAYYPDLGVSIVVMAMYWIFSMALAALIFRERRL